MNTTTATATPEPIEVSCPHCHSSEIQGADVVLVNAAISAFTLNAAGELEPQWGGESDVDWNSQAPEDKSRPFMCASCDARLSGADLMPGTKPPAVLTPQQREAITEKLCANLVEGTNRMALALWDMAKDGFVGYAQRSDAELLEAYSDAFEEDFLTDHED